MANPEHFEILEQGGEVWNRWREKNPEILPDLHGMDLSHIKLTGANLKRACLRNADLEGAQLDGAYFV